MTNFRGRTIVSIALALSVGLVGAAAVLGWVAGASWLTTLGSSSTPITANSGLFFFLLSLSVALYNLTGHPQLRRGARAVSLAVLLLALATLGQDLFSYELGLDLLLAHSQPLTPNDSAPGRMSPLTALCLALIALACLLYEHPNYRLMQTSSLLAAGLGFLVVTGYIYGVSSFYQPLGGIYKMSLQAALMSITLALAVLLARQPQGGLAVAFSASAVSILTRRLLFVALVLPFLLGILMIYGQRAGLYDIGMGTALLVLSIIAILTVAVLWNANHLQQAETARERAELEMLVSESRLASLVNSAMDAVIGLNNAQEIVLFNPAAEMMFGYPTEEIAGQRIDRLVPERFRAIHRQHIEDYAESGMTSRRMGALGQIFGRRADGSEFPVEASISQAIVQGERLFAVILRDISERRLMEQTLELKNQDLLRSNQELEQFAYVASHDLQEPLRMVSSYMELVNKLYKDELNEEAREFIDFAVDGANRMKQLINDLLTFSRVGTRGGEPEVVESQEALELAQRNLQLMIAESGAQIVAGPLPAVTVDGSQLVQVFQNLLGNAIKFRGEQVPRIRIAAQSRDGFIEFSIKDNGIGFNPAYADRIFVIFQQLHGRDEYSGTGIGLAICKKIIERHGGRIWAESQPGKGATFYFTLPAALYPFDSQEDGRNEGQAEETLEDRARRLI